MAELNRDLQEYLMSSSRPGGSGGQGRGQAQQPATQPPGRGWTWPGRLGVPWGRADDTGTPPPRGEGIIPSLSKKQRIVGFVGFIAMGVFCFSLAAMYAPFMLLKARKFALLYTMGSLFVISSFSLLWGPWSHVRHLCSAERLPFTSAYFGSMAFTLYFALWMQSTLLTSVGAIVQSVALLWYLISYIPGGQAGLQFFTSLFSSAVKRSQQNAACLTHAHTRTHTRTHGHTHGHAHNNNRRPPLIGGDVTAQPVPGQAHLEATT